ncbi:hypothetical protein D3C86_1074170 [compost metagenome]
MKPKGIGRSLIGIETLRQESTRNSPSPGSTLFCILTITGIWGPVLLAYLWQNSETFR